MTTRRILRKSTQILLATGLGCAVFVGCNTGRQVADREPEPVAMSKNGREASLAITGGAQLWAENCIRCHNIRNPASLSDRQWEIVLHHMRVRANLTTQEHELILEFLKAAN